MARKELDVENVGQNQAEDMSTLAAKQSMAVGKVAYTGADMTSDALDLEAFMNERVTIIVHHDNTPGALDVINPICCGINHPIRRGVQTKVRRMIVEVLARARNENFTQVQARPEDRASLKLVPKATPAFPFSVIHDPNPKGIEWLDNILRQPC